MSAVLNAENVHSLAHGNDSYTKMSSEVTQHKLELKRRSSAQRMVDDIQNKPRNSKRRRRKTGSEEQLNGAADSALRNDSAVDKIETQQSNGSVEASEVSKKSDLRKSGRTRRDEDDHEKPARKMSKRLEQSNGRADFKAEVKAAKSDNKEKSEPAASKLEKALKTAEKPSSADLRPQKDSRADKMVNRNEEKDKSTKSDKNGDRERNVLAERRTEKSRNFDRTADAEKQIDQLASDSENEVNYSEEDNDLAREELSTSDSEEDLQELERRKADKTELLAELERQFRDLREALFTEKLAAIDERLSDIRTERATEFSAPRSVLRETVDTRCSVAKLTRKFRAESEAQRNASSRSASLLSIDERKRLSVDALRDEICAQLSTLFTRAHCSEAARARNQSNLRTRKLGRSAQSPAKRASKVQRSEAASGSQSTTDSDERTRVDCTIQPLDEAPDEDEVEMPPDGARTATQVLRGRLAEPRRNGVARRQRAKRMAKRKVNEPYIVYQLNSDEIQDDIVQLRSAAARAPPFYTTASFNYAAPFGSAAASGPQQQTATSTSQLHASTTYLTLGGAQRSAVPHGSGTQFGLFPANSFIGPQVLLGRTSVVT